MKLKLTKTVVQDFKDDRELYATLYGGYMELLYQSLMKMQNNKDGYDIARNALMSDLQDGTTYTDTNGELRNGLKPIADRIGVLKEILDFGKKDAYSQKELEEFRNAREKRIESYNTDSNQSGRWEDRQAFQTNEMRENQPDYANSELFELNMETERMESLKSQIERMHRVVNPSKLQKDRLRQMRKSAEELAEHIDQLRRHPSVSAYV